MNGLMERLNRTTTEMMIKGLHQQEDWPDFVQTCAWNIRSNVHKSTNYQPIHLLIGRRPKMLPECINYSTDIKDTADFTDEEVKMVMDGVSDENLKCLIGIIKDILHSNAHLNMKKSSARQKKNYDLKNAMPMKLAVGDLVLKIKQKNLSRKGGGRLDDRIEEQLFHVESIMSNGNLKLMSEKSKEMYPHSIPLSRVKRFLLKKRSCPTSSKYVETSAKVPKTAKNSTIAMSSPSASGSPSTSKFVTPSTTLTLPARHPTQTNPIIDRTGHNTVINPTATSSGCSGQLVHSSGPTVTLPISHTVENIATVLTTSVMNTNMCKHPQLSTAANTVKKSATGIPKSTLK